MTDELGYVDNRTKQCTGCFEVKSLSLFYFNIHGRDMRTSRCKECMKAARKKYYHANKEKEKDYRDWYNRQPYVKMMRRGYEAARKAKKED